MQECEAVQSDKHCVWTGQQGHHSLQCLAQEVIKGSMQCPASKCADLFTQLVGNFVLTYFKFFPPLNPSLF